MSRCGALLPGQLRVEATWQFVASERNNIVCAQHDDRFKLGKLTNRHHGVT